MPEDTVARREDRKDVDWIAVIRLHDGTDLPCSVKDVSPSGLRICVPENQDLPETFMVKVVGIPLVFAVRRTWRRKHFVGCTIDKIAKLPEPKATVAEAQRTPLKAHTRLGTRTRYGAQA